MPHAFRSAAAIEAEAAQKKIDRLRERWASTKNDWFDGSVESLDRRIAWLNEVETTAKSTASRLYQAKVGADAMALLPQIRADRERLTSARERLAGGEWVPEGVDSADHNLDPRNYDSRREWIDAQNGSRFGEFGAEYGQQNDYPVPSLHHDMTGRDEALHHAAREFVEEQNTSDRAELRIRAQRLMEDRTSSWEPRAAVSTVRSFVAAVDAAAPRPRRTASAPVVEVLPDFDDHLMFS